MWAKRPDERAIESALVRHITQFLLELGAGFALVGRQVHLEVGGDDFFIDLLFYHLKLRCYVVIELKADKFKPEHLGQLGFYLTAVDRQVKAEQDNPSIGLLLCKSKNKVVAEYALGDKTQPMGIAEYKLLESLPEPLQTSLPTIEQIERELEGAMTDYQPPYTITPEILNRVAAISEAIGRLTMLADQARTLRRINRIRTIHGSLAIEATVSAKRMISSCSTAPWKWCSRRCLMMRPILSPPWRAEPGDGGMLSRFISQAWPAPTLPGILSMLGRSEPCSRKRIVRKALHDLFAAAIQV
nr:DUF1016 domain-containing protein [Desulfobulbus propionicus]